MKNKKGFTIVELIVVITILGILSTIGFISYSGYILGARDSNRLAQLEGLTKGLNVSLTTGRLPLPDNKVLICSGTVNTTNAFAYQGSVGETVIERIGYSNDGIDPKDKTRFTYYVNKNRKYFQLMGFLEDENSKLAGIVNNTYAAIDYSDRFPTVSGKKMGILVTDTNQPLNEYLLGAGLTGVDITNINNQVLKSYMKDDNFVTGSGTTFADLVKVDKVGGKYYTASGNTFYYNPPN